MAPLSSDRQGARDTGKTSFAPVTAAVLIYAGAAIVADANGNAKPATGALGLKTLGRAREQVDNSGGGAGDANVSYDIGVFPWDNSDAGADQITQADVKKMVYWVDDHTVARTNGAGTRSEAGIVERIDDDGVWIHTGESPRRELVSLIRKIETVKASTAGVYRVVAPISGFIKLISAVLDAAIVTADATITATINGVAVTGGVVTLTQAASAAGTKGSARPTAANWANEGDTIELTVGGGATTDVVATATVLIEG